MYLLNNVFIDILRINIKKGNIIHIYIIHIYIYITYLEIKDYIYIRRKVVHIAQLGERQTEDLKVMCSIHIVDMITRMGSLSGYIYI